ncbi:UNVERIFIED_ORG: type IV secretory system conjugative DNA transfer VirD4/TraG family protein [Anoxybacillus amylolyticus]
MLEKARQIFSQYGFLILLFVFSVQTVHVLMQAWLMQSLLWLVWLPVVVITLIFLFEKERFSEKDRRMAFQLWVASLGLMCIGFVQHVMAMVSIRLAQGSEETRSFFSMAYYLDGLLLLWFLYLWKHTSLKEKLKQMEEMPFSFRPKASVIEKKQGDVQICIDKETGKPVILPYKDRFLHMLILGPTGSGKTSQTILPMVHQDIQNRDAGITVLEPKGDLAEKVYVMALHYGREVIYFNPLLPDCPYFNPLHGQEDDVIENMVTTFKMLNPDSPQFFKDMNETLLRNALKVLKRLYGNRATFIDLNRLLTNANGMGRSMVLEFSRLPAPNEAIAKENADIAAWFLNEYFGERSKTYEHCSGLRSQVTKLISNKYLRRVLNPPNGENDVDFDKYLSEGKVLTISTAQGKLRDLGRFLGYFIILQFQSAVFRRPGNENTRRPHFLYIDEFQVYANSGFADMLTQGRSYRVASHLATQNRALIGMGAGREGKDFIELVSTNARNVIIYPGGNAIDAKYYSEQFGEIIKKEVQKGISRQKFSFLKGFKPLNYDTESIREVEKREARFSPSDIIYRPFGEITYCIIQHNSITPPGVGKIEYIPKELNDKLDRMIEELQQTVFAKEEDHEEEESIPPFTTEEPKEVQDAVIRDFAPVSVNAKEAAEREGKEIVYGDEDYVDDIILSMTGEDVSTKEEHDNGTQEAKSDQNKGHALFIESVEDDFLY